MIGGGKRILGGAVLGEKLKEGFPRIAREMDGVIPGGVEFGDMSPLPGKDQDFLEGDSLGRSESWGGP